MPGGGGVEDDGVEVGLAVRALAQVVKLAQAHQFVKAGGGVGELRQHLAIDNPVVQQVQRNGSVDVFLHRQATVEAADPQVWARLSQLVGDFGSQQRMHDVFTLVNGEQGLFAIARALRGQRRGDRGFPHAAFAGDNQQLAGGYACLVSRGWAGISHRVVTGDVSTRAARLLRLVGSARACGVALRSGQIANRVSGSIAPSGAGSMWSKLASRLMPVSRGRLLALRYHPQIRFCTYGSSGEDAPRPLSAMLASGRWPDLKRARKGSTALVRQRERLDGVGGSGARRVCRHRDVPDARLRSAPVSSLCRSLLWLLDGIGAQGRNRTTDTGIFSPLLYRLSYLGERPGVGVSRARGLRSGV